MEIGKIIFWLGLGITFVGLLIWLGAKIGIPFGKLPGDFQWSGESYGVYFPIVSSIVISILLTIGLNVVLWLFRK
jgi:hypothetical protein